MAEPDRELFRATHLDGKPLSDGAVVLLFWMWSKIRSAVARAHREEGGPQPALRFTKDDLLKIRPWSQRTVDRHLSDLIASRWIKVISRKRDEWAVGLNGPADRARVLAALGHPMSTPDRQGSSRSDVTSTANPMADPPDDKCPRSLPKIADPMPDLTGISANSGSGLNLSSNSLTTQLSSGSLPALASFAGTRAGSAHSLAMQRAREIVQGAICPNGAAPLLLHDAALKPLARALLAGLLEADARSLLAEAPEIIERGLQNSEWYTPESLWQGERMSRWRTAQAKLHRIKLAETKQRDLQVAAQRTAQAQLMRQVDVELLAAETEAKRLAAGALNPHEQAAVAGGNPMMLRTVEKAKATVAALQHAEQLAKAAGREISEAERRDVLLGRSETIANVEVQ